MASNVFLVPCDPENFDRTVRSAIDLTEYPNRPSVLAEMKSVRFWGAREGANNQTYFEKMQSDDLVLFYQDSEYIGTGWIGTTFTDKDEWASTTFWNGAPATQIYTIKSFTPVSVPKQAVNRIFDYADGYTPQGLMRVADDRVTNRLVAIKHALAKYTKKHR